MTCGQRCAIGLAALYAVVGIVTFGHAGASAEKVEEIDYQQCRADRRAYLDRYGVEPDSFCLRNDIYGLTAAMAATFWPFYWSWDYWEKH